MVLGKPKRRIRLLMPFDIRTKEDLRLTAANRLSFAFLGRTHSNAMISNHFWQRASRNQEDQG